MPAHSDGCQMPDYLWIMARRVAGRRSSLFVAMLATLAVVVSGCGSGAQPDNRQSPTDDEKTGLKVGALLSGTGDLGVFGNAIAAAARLTADDINAAGGVNGGPIQLVVEDDGTDEQVARAKVRKLLESKISAIIGPASSRIALATIDDVVGANVVECSPSATTPLLASYPDKGLFFRVVASDVQQGKALAGRVLRDGHRRVAVAAINDAYGQGLSAAFVQAFKQGGGVVSRSVTYDPRGLDFMADARRAIAGDPDAFVLIGLPETGGHFLADLRRLGAGTNTLATYGTDGLQTESLPGLVDPQHQNVVDGLVATGPKAPNAEFLARLKKYAPSAQEFVYAEQGSDCMTVLALAASAAGSNASTLIASNITAVTTGGTRCTTFTDCRRLLEQGKDIDFVGVSGELDLTGTGELTSAEYDIWTFRNGKIVTVEAAGGVGPGSKS